jgi:hypothetical protein
MAVSERKAILVPPMPLENPEALPSRIPSPKIEYGEVVIWDERVPGTEIISTKASEYKATCLRIILSI